MDCVSQGAVSALVLRQSRTRHGLRQSRSCERASTATVKNKAWTAAVTEALCERARNATVENKAWTAAVKNKNRHRFHRKPRLG